MSKFDPKVKSARSSLRNVLGIIYGESYPHRSFQNTMIIFDILAVRDKTIDVLVCHGKLPESSTLVRDGKYPVEIQTWVTILHA